MLPLFPPSYTGILVPPSLAFSAIGPANLTRFVQTKGAIAWG